ncbi:MAG: diheme cytochrome c [Magnetococcus sp. DMHC-6]
MQKTAQTLLALTFLASTALIVSTGITEEEHGTKKSTRPIPYDPEYVKECGACHIAYPPKLLPTASWEKLMSDLTNHFGENAELDSAIQTRLTTYLQKSSKPSKSTKQEPLVRISEQRWFTKDHKEIKTKIAKSDKETIKLSSCNTCHPNAARGSFEEDEINIPGIGRWED